MYARVLTLLLLLVLLLPGQEGLRAAEENGCGAAGAATPLVAACCCGNRAMACHGQCCTHGGVHLALLPAVFDLAAPASIDAFKKTGQHLAPFPPPAAIYHPPRRQAV